MISIITFHHDHLIISIIIIIIMTGELIVKNAMDCFDLTSFTDSSSYEDFYLYLHGLRYLSIAIPSSAFTRPAVPVFIIPDSVTVRGHHHTLTKVFPHNNTGRYFDDFFLLS